MTADSSQSPGHSSGGAPVALDPRRHPFREDLAAEELRGRVAAPRYASGVRRQVRLGVADLKTAPGARAPLASQVLFGELFMVYAVAEGWAWGQCAHDGYVGYLRETALTPESGPAPAPVTHRVAVLRTFLFSAPSIKAPVETALSLATPLRGAVADGLFLRLAGGGWVFAAHCAPVGCGDPDPATTAARFLGLPYLWGGRSSLGIDCSGLAQIALAWAGIAAPRDSDMQCAEVGRRIAEAAAPATGFQRGDLVFFPGHVGIMADAHTLTHATAFTLSVINEPVAAVAERAGGIVAVQRLERGKSPDGRG